MSILGLVKEVQRELKVFKDHPAIKLNTDEQVFYLKGLALVMNVDDEVHIKEKEYLLTLINTFDLPQNKLNVFVEFSQNPTKDEMKDILVLISKSGLTEAFLTDCLMVSYADGKIRTTEKSLFDIYCDILEVDEIEKNTLIKKAKLNNKKNVIKETIAENYDISSFDNIFSSEKIIVSTKSIYDKNTIFINCELEFTGGSLSFNSKNIRFVGCKILSPIIDFSNIKNIEIEDCKIEAKENFQTKLYGSNINRILIKDTSFKDIKNDDELLSFYDALNCDVKIKNCDFNNCSSNYYDLFSFSKIKSVKMTSNNLNNCTSFFKHYNHLFNFDTVTDISVFDNTFNNSGASSERSSHLFYFDSSVNISIGDNTLNHCSIVGASMDSRSGSSYSSLFYFGNTSSLSLVDNNFNDCLSTANLLSLVNTKNGEIKNTSFKNCKHEKNNVELIDSEDIEIIDTDIYG